MPEWTPPDGTAAPTREQMIQLVQKWAKNHPNVRRVWLYGSRITGFRKGTSEPSASNSDWDVAIQLDGNDPEERRRSWFDLIDTANAEMDELACWKVHVDHNDPDVVPKLTVSEAVENYGILVYTRNIP